jgi:transcriptional regulator with XRE-family HTH domain
MLLLVDAARRLREARRLAGLSQAELACRAGTSQATVSAYESARKQPSVATLSRLLAAAGARLTVEHGRAPVVLPSPADHARAGRALGEVLSLAASLPVRHERRLRYPPLRPVADRAA